MRHTTYHIVFSFRWPFIKMYRITHDDRMRIKQMCCSFISKSYKSRKCSPNVDWVKFFTGNLYANLVKYL